MGSATAVPFWIFCFSGTGVPPTASNVTNTASTSLYVPAVSPGTHVSLSGIVIVSLFAVTFASSVTPLP